jgi:hypothetical protein
MQWTIFAALGLAIALVLINEFVFGGQFMASSAVALSIGLLSIAAAAAVTIAARYRHKTGALFRDVAIWICILGAVAIVYWTLG